MRSSVSRRRPRLRAPDAAARAESLAERLHAAMGVLGIVFVLLVLGEVIARHEPLHSFLAAAIFVIWLVFVIEFITRLWLCPHKLRFLRRNWWQALLLIVPILSSLRILAAIRVARAGRIVSSAIRATRSAKAALTSRVGWLAAVHTIVVLSAAELLYEYARFDTFGEALHRAAFAAATGAAFAEGHGAFARVTEVILGLYSVVFFASVAGSVGAYLLERRREDLSMPRSRSGPEAHIATLRSDDGEVSRGDPYA